MDSKNTQGGPVLPTTEAIKILNENAKAASERSRYATLVQAGATTNRDALRRDFAPRQPEVNLPGTQAVPADQAPKPPESPINAINNLVDQFLGQGGGGGRSNFVTRGSPDPKPPTTPTQYQANPVQTFMNDVQQGPAAAQEPTSPAAAAAATPQAIVRFESTGEYQMGSPVFRAVMGPGVGARYNWFINAMVNPGVVIPNVSAANIRRS